MPDLTSTHDQRVGFSTTNTLDLTTTSTRDEGITEHITTNSLNSASTHNDTNHMHDTTSSLSPTNTDMHNQESRTSIPASTTEVSVVSNSQETVRIIPYAVGRAMGGLVVITVITLVTVIVTFIIKRKQQKSHEVESFNNNGLPKLAYDNAVYNLGR